MNETSNKTNTTEYGKMYAAIDLGTVTCRLMVARFVSGKMDVLARRSAFVHLGEDVDKTGMIKPEAIVRAKAQVDEYMDIIQHVAAGEDVVISAIATSASRDAENSQDIVDALAECGVELQIVPGEQEAAFCFAGATSDYAGERVLVIDTGGGSTELIAGVGGQAPIYACSYQIGCRRATERFYASDPPTEKELAASYAWMKPQFAETFKELADLDFHPRRLIAVAGTATSMVSIDQAMDPYDSERVHGTVVPAATLERLFRRLASMSIKQREQVIGLQPQRAPLIVAGAQILRTVLELSGESSFTVSECDLLEGIIQLTASGLNSTTSVS